MWPKRNRGLQKEQPVAKTRKKARDLPNKAYFVSILPSFTDPNAMGLPGHRRTSSDKRRRASHFALEKPSIVKDSKTGAVHLSHRAAPGATEYNGHEIHVKGQKRKLEKLLQTKTKKTDSKKEPAQGHDHDHDHGHDHSHDHTGHSH
jgi:ribosomal protein L32